MSDPPVRDHRGEGSYQKRLENYQEQQRLEQIKANAERTQASCLVPGPSGMPVRHFTQASGRSNAKEIALSSGYGHTPIYHTAHSPDQKPHFHLTDASGEKGNQNTPHIEFKPKNSSLPSPKLQRKNF